MGLADLQLVDGVGGDVVGQFGGFPPANLDLAHVADIEDAGRVAHRVVLVDDAGVLDGHVPSTEIHHPGAERSVDTVQGRGAESTTRCATRPASSMSATWARSRFAGGKPPN